MPEDATKPKIVVVIVGSKPASKVYVNMKHKKAQALGMLSEIIELSENTSQQDLLDIIQNLNTYVSVKFNKMLNNKIGECGIILTEISKPLWKNNIHIHKINHFLLTILNYPTIANGY